MKKETISIKKLTKEFKGGKRKVVALHDVTLDIEKGIFFVVLGPSGCGKSTLLNILAGLESPTAGEIRFGDTLVASTDKKHNLTPRERNIAMVFQSYALYPHMNVFENIAFPLSIMKTPRDEIDKGVHDVAKLLDIESLLSSKPRELSGGQRQRVAIARALVRNPSVFLLDEPLSNLDAQLRVRLREELKSLQQRLGVTTVYVTHDQAEAMTLGDKIAILRKGELQQVDQPLEVYGKPINSFVARFIGTPPMNLLEGKILEKEGTKSIQFCNKEFALDEKTARKIEELKQEKLLVGIRPEQIRITDTAEPHSFQAKVTFVEHLGSESIIYAVVENEKIAVKLAEDRDIKTGSVLNLNIKIEQIHLFEKDGDNIITTKKQ